MAATATTPTTETKTGEQPPPAGDAAAKTAADAAAAAATEKAAADKAAADAAAAAGGKKPEDGQAAPEGETKPDGSKKADEPPAPKAPDKYELTIPEGGLVDSNDLARVEALAREHNLPNEAAQSMLETGNALMVEQAVAWRAELDADKTYGGEKYAETERLANLVLDKVRPAGTPRGDGIRKLLQRGVGHNLEVVSFLADLGKMMKEDAPITGELKTGEDRSKKPIANRMYPNAKS